LSLNRSGVDSNDLRDNTRYLLKLIGDSNTRLNANFASWGEGFWLLHSVISEC